MLSWLKKPLKSRVAFRTKAWGCVWLLKCNLITKLSIQHIPAMDMCSSILGQNTHKSVGQDFICATSLPWECWPKWERLECVWRCLSETNPGSHQEFSKWSRDIASGTGRTQHRKAGVECFVREVVDVGFLGFQLHVLLRAGCVEIMKQSSWGKLNGHTVPGWFCFSGDPHFPEKCTSPSFERWTKLELFWSQS